MARNVKFEIRRGAGSSLEVLFGKVSLTPTMLHTVANSVVLPAPSTFDLVNGVAIATNVAPSPAPVEGQVPWAYRVKISDNHGKTFEYLVGVPDGTTEINFNVLPRYFETKPPLFGQGEQGVPGSAATIAIGNTTSGTSPAVTNSGTSTDAVLDFTLPKGDKGDTGAGVPAGGTALQVVRKNADNTTTEWATADKDLVGLGNVDNTSDANKPVSTAQKTYIDQSNTLPYNTVTFTALPNTYPEGTTVALGNTATGWPNLGGSETFTMVTTDRSPNFAGGAVQWLSAYKNPDATLQYRVANSDNTWGALKKIVVDDGSLVRQGDIVYTAASFGAVGDGVANDYWAISAAINAAGGRDVLLEEGKVYRIAGTLTVPANSRKVSLVSTGGGAVISPGGSGQSYSPVDFAPSTPSFERSLTARVTAGTTDGWAVSATTGIIPGMLCEVISSRSWYFDPRPESTDARKSELHKVRQVLDGKVFFFDPANDGYDLASESVILRFHEPIFVNMENIIVRGILPAPAESTGAITGVPVRLADNPTFTNVSVEECAGAGIRTTLCYRPTIIGGYTDKANDYFTGYGVQFSGCAFAYVENRFTYHSRRGIDNSGAQVVSRNTRMKGCVTVGGGKNSRGNAYGWNPDGSLAADQFGFGSHGPSDQTEYDSCHTYNVKRPYSLRGRDERVLNPRHVGPTFGGVIQLTTGTNFYLQGGLITGGTWSYKTVAGGVAWPAFALRPDDLVRVYNTYQVNPEMGIQGGRFEISGVSAEVQNSIVRFQTVSTTPYPLGHFSISDMDIKYWTGPTRSYYTIHLDQDPAGYNKSRTFISNVRETSDSATGTKALCNYPLSGANVISYSVIP